MSVMVQLPSFTIFLSCHNFMWKHLMMYQYISSWSMWSSTSTEHSLVTNNIFGDEKSGETLPQVMKESSSSICLWNVWHWWAGHLWVADEVAHGTISIHSHLFSFHKKGTMDPRKTTKCTWVVPTDFRNKIKNMVFIL